MKVVTSEASHASSTKELKNFAIVMAVAFGGVFGTLVPWWKRGEITPRLIAVGVAFLALGLIAPKLLKPIYVVWMKLGEALGYVNSRIILSVVFYTLFFPLGVILRLMGRDAMARKLDKKVVSYRVPAAYDKDMSSGMERPF